MRYFIATVLAVGGLWAQQAWGQPDSLWSRTYGGRDDEECYSIIQTADRGYALAGNTVSFDARWSDFWLVRTDSSGDSLWSRTFGGRVDDECHSLIQTADGGLALAGYTGSFGVGQDDFWLVRTDAAGRFLWSRTFGGQNNDGCFSLIQTADGGFALAGYTYSFGAGESDVWLVRTDENGDSLWSRTYGGEDIESCLSLIQTADGGFALGGYTYSFGASESDIWLVRTDENGDSLWSQTYGYARGSNDYCLELIQMADSGFTLAGNTGSAGGVEDFWLVRTNANGNLLWSLTFGDDDDDHCNSLIQTADGGFALAGRTTSFGAGSRDFWLVRTDAEGNNLWSRTFGGRDNDNCLSLIQTAEGGFALAGYTNSFGEGSHDFWLVKTGPDPQPPSPFGLLAPSDGDTVDLGEITFAWERAIDPNREDIVSYLLWLRAEADSVNIFSRDTILTVDIGRSGLNPEGGQEITWWVQAVSPPDTVECRERFHFVLRSQRVAEGSPPSALSLTFQPPYPNPFNSSLNLSFQTARPGYVALELLDPTGRRVARLFDGFAPAGERRLVWNAEGIAAGRYWVRLWDAQGAGAVSSVVLVR